MENKLWNRNFTIIIVATIFGACGNIAGSFALSFLVFEETQSTLAAALTVALRVIPYFLVPLFIAPMMDRLPRKPFLVGCDFISSIIMLVSALWLKANEFNYILYLGYSLILATIGSFDWLSYEALYPKLITKGFEEKGYSIASMIYPMLTVLMMPLSAILYETIGVANILLIQSALCFLTAVTESSIKIKETVVEGTDFSIKQWWWDIVDAYHYLKDEKGILAFTMYSGVGSAMYQATEPIIVAFFSISPMLTVSMYSFFSVAECIGRTIGGMYLLKNERPKEKKYNYCLFVYFLYESMDMILLWISYPLMLINRAVCGFLGAQSGPMRNAATQKYIPDGMRARIMAFQSIVEMGLAAILSIVIGILGEFLDYRLVFSIGGFITFTVCMLTIVRQKKAVTDIYMYEKVEEEEI